ncbi:MAG: ATP/GTP-binding protein [Zestosphaera sp.]
MQALVLTGLGGSGKTFLTAAFSKWLEEEFHVSVGILNLDPAVETLPYTPDFDVRELIDFKKLMIDEGLGPNGAMVRASDMLADMVGEFINRVRILKKDLLLVDTPGQSELFVLRRSGPKVIDSLRGLASPAVVHLIDPTISESPSELVISYLMSLVVRLRLSVPVIPVVSKSDLLNRVIGKTLPDEINDLAGKLAGSDGLLNEVANELIKLLQIYAVPTRIVAVSAITGDGFNDLYSIIREVFCSCGDLT